MTKLIPDSFKRLPSCDCVTLNLDLPLGTVLSQYYSFALVNSKEVRCSIVGLEICGCLLGASRVVLVQSVLCYLRYPL